MMFSKPLTKTDISKRLAIPTSRLPLFPALPSEDGGNEIEMEVWDDNYYDGNSNGKLWKFVFKIRNNDKYRKPVFSTGWLDFVRAKGLAVDDVVTLYKTENRTRLFGNVVSQLRYSIEVVVMRGAEAEASAAGGLF